MPSHLDDKQKRINLTKVRMSEVVAILIDSTESDLKEKMAAPRYVAEIARYDNTLTQQRGI